MLDVEKLEKAAPVNKKTVQPLTDIKLDWSDLIPEVSPYLESDATDAAKKFLTKKGLTGKDPMWTKVLSQAKEIAHKRSAELVGKKILQDGTIVDNPSSKWSISETTRVNLNELAGKAVDEGRTVNQLQHEIIGSEDFSASRALNISRTEKAYAHGHGQHTAATEVGMKFKDWDVADGCCELCQANADQGRIPISEDFESGDVCVPCHPSDRCDNGYYETEDGD